MGDVTNFGGTMSFDLKIDNPEEMQRILNAIAGTDKKIKQPKKDPDWMRRNGFYQSKGEFGIKALDGDQFAILYIPKGAMVHVDFARSNQLYFTYGFGANTNIRFEPEEKALRKHRADEAYIVAICKLVYEKKQGKVEHASFKPYAYCDEKLSLEIMYDGKSCRDKDFGYHTGAHLVIGTYDYDHDEACSQGVHYFTNAQQTLNYIYDMRGGLFLPSNDTILKNLMYTTHGGELLNPWMAEQIEQFKNGWGKDAYDEPCEDNDEKETDCTADSALDRAIRKAHEALDGLVEAASSLKPAERTDLGRYSNRHPARGTRCNCDTGDASDDRPP